jgi:hypothetical protein
LAASAIRRVVVRLLGAGIQFDVDAIDADRLVGQAVAIGEQEPGGIDAGGGIWAIEDLDQALDCGEAMEAAEGGNAGLL